MHQNIKAALLSAFLLPGLGQLAKGDRVKGGIFILLVNIFLLGALFMLLRGMGPVLLAAKTGGTPDVIKTIETIRQSSPEVRWLLWGFGFLWLAGVLDAAISMVNEFLPQGRLIVYTQGKTMPRSDAVATGSGSFQNSQVVVLLDEFSASSSEIFAGAIQDNDRGLIIGRRSYGKGLVQQQYSLADGSALRLTIARYYTPSGRCIQKDYTLGDQKDYEEDIMNRYLHGEFDSKQAAAFPQRTRARRSRQPGPGLELLRRVRTQVPDSPSPPTTASGSGRPAFLNAALL